MDIRYSKNTERPVAEIVKEHFSLAINKPAGEYDRNLTDIVLYAGDEYKVKHNGSEYTCVAYEEDGAIHIGGESEPFDIYNFDGDIYVKAETDGANTFEVHHEKVKTFDYDVMPEGYPGVKQEVVTPIDYKFMPEGYPKVEMEDGQEVVTPLDPKFVGGTNMFWVNIIAEFNEDYEILSISTDKTFDEINEALTGYKTVMGLYYGNVYTFNGWIDTDSQELTFTRFCPNGISPESGLLTIECEYFHYSNTVGNKWIKGRMTFEPSSSYLDFGGVE